MVLLSACTWRQLHLRSSPRWIGESNDPSREVQIDLATCGFIQAQALMGVLYGPTLAEKFKVGRKAATSARRL